MYWQFLWFVLAGFVLGFAISTLWEWFHFRRERMRLTDRRVAELEAQLRVYAARQQELEEAARLVPPWTPPDYDTRDPYVESERAEPAVGYAGAPSDVDDVNRRDLAAVAAEATAGAAVRAGEQDTRHDESASTVGVPPAPEISDPVMPEPVMPEPVAPISRAPIPVDEDEAFADDILAAEEAAARLALAAAATEDHARAPTTIESNSSPVDGGAADDQAAPSLLDAAVRTGAELDAVPAPESVPYSEPVVTAVDVDIVTPADASSPAGEPVVDATLDSVEPSVAVGDTAVDIAAAAEADFEIDYDDGEFSPVVRAGPAGTVAPAADLPADDAAVTQQAAMLAAALAAARRLDAEARAEVSTPSPDAHLTEVSPAAVAARLVDPSRVQATVREATVRKVAREDDREDAYAAEPDRLDSATQSLSTPEPVAAESDASQQAGAAAAAIDAADDATVVTEIDAEAGSVVERETDPAIDRAIDTEIDEPGELDPVETELSASITADAVVSDHRFQSVVVPVDAGEELDEGFPTVDSIAADEAAAATGASAVGSAIYQARREHLAELAAATRQWHAGDDAVTAQTAATATRVTAVDLGGHQGTDPDFGPRPAAPAGYPDNLSRIKGIGKVYRARLNAAGIYTWHQLAETSPDDLRAIANPPVSADVDEWPERARQLAQRHGRVGAVYTGPPPDDLSAIRGIGPFAMQLLYKAGICTFAELAAQGPERLAAIIPRSPNGDEIDHGRWIKDALAAAQARGL